MTNDPTYRTQLGTVRLTGPTVTLKHLKAIQLGSFEVGLSLLYFGGEWRWLGPYTLTVTQPNPERFRMSFLDLHSFAELRTCLTSRQRLACVAVSSTY